MRSRGRLSRDPHFWPFWNFYYFFFFFRVNVCAVHTIYCRENELVEIRIFSSVLSLHAGLRLVACAADAAKRFPPVRLGGRKVGEVGGAVGVCVRSLSSRVVALTLHSFLSLSLRHNIHIDTQNTRCLIYSACPKSVAPFIFPPSPYTEEAKLKCGSAYRRVFLFSCQSSSSYDAHNPKKERKKNLIWELVKFLIWCLYVYLWNKQAKHVQDIETLYTPVLGCVMLNEPCLMVRKFQRKSWFPHLYLSQR